MNRVFMMGFKSISLLLWLRFRGNLRLRFKELAGVKGIISIGSIALFVGWLIYVANSQLDSFTLAQLADQQYAIQTVLPLGVILAIASTVLMGSGPALYFNQAETNLLWTAPVSRACLITYKLCSYAAGAIVTACLIAVLLPGDLSARVVRFISLFLTLMFVQTSSTALRMTIATVLLPYPGGAPNKRMGIRLSFWAAAILTITLLPVITWQFVPTSGVFQFLNNLWVDTLILPFAVVSNLMLHEQFGRDFASDCCIVIAMIALLARIIIILDRRLEQTMLEESVYAQRRWARALRSGILSARNHKSDSSSRPPFRLGGMGPILWSRWLYSLRSSGHVLTAMMLTAALVGLVAGSQLSAANSVYLASAAFFASVYFLPRVLIFDFRGAPQLMETLHGLPVPNSLICMGHIMVPVFWKSAIELTVVTGMLFTAPQVSPAVWLVTFFTLPLVNFLIVGLDNLLFLLRPTRLLPVGRMDFDFLGSTLFDFLVKSLVLALTAAIAIGAAFWLTLAMNGQSLIFTVGVYAVVLSCCWILQTILTRTFASADITDFDRL